jgi:hypothetical protein
MDIYSGHNPDGSNESKMERINASMRSIRAHSRLHRQCIYDRHSQTAECEYDGTNQSIHTIRALYLQPEKATSTHYRTRATHAPDSKLSTPGTRKDDRFSSKALKTKNGIASFLPTFMSLTFPPISARKKLRRPVASRRPTQDQKKRKQKPPDPATP